MSAHGLEQAMLCPDVAMCIFPTVVQESFMAEWGLDLSRPLAKKGDDENKLRTYRLFKDSFHFENYLDNIKIKKHRVALTRFRLSCHNLQIEAGRHHIPKIPYDRRLCDECGVIQDEIHALSFCRLYSEYREGFMKVFHEQTIDVFQNISSTLLFRFIMNCEDPKVQRALGAFVYHILIVYFYCFNIILFPMGYPGFMWN